MNGSRTKVSTVRALMPSIRGVLTALVYFVGEPSWVVAQIPFCARPTAPNRLTDQPQEVEWWADADLVDSAGDRYQMTRVVVNRDTVPRRVTWRGGRMDVASLAPGEWARHCPPVGVGRDIVDAPLYIYSNGKSLPARVYQNYHEPSEVAVRRGMGELRLTTFAQGTLTSDGAESALEFTSEVTYEDDRYVVRYMIRNTGRRRLFIRLHGLPDGLMADFREALLPLGPGAEPIRFQVTSESFPMSGWVSASVGESRSLLDVRVGLFGFYTREGW